MACELSKNLGKVVLLEYAIECGDIKPEPEDWKRFAPMRTKEFNPTWDTTDATDDQSPGSTRENLATFLGLSISGDGTVKTGGEGSEALKELQKHVIKPSKTGGQPNIWLRMTYPDLTYTAFMLITSLTRSSPHDDIETFSFEAINGVTEFPIEVEDTLVKP